ncbi:hypothetical protein RHMOL_Rhmol09G0189600 [Rhododendron molle]|uniref:Uncharacterized protein n=1 Tax=Rhododendron molle TaxID=49168 RepID=A0ACC0MEY5_RHOML|nr:hypothetical protein RHMOL_Rhmol09G0189600 [Rhododendron molle]
MQSRLLIAEINGPDMQSAAQHLPSTIQASKTNTNALSALYLTLSNVLQQRLGYLSSNREYTHQCSLRNEKSKTYLELLYWLNIFRQSAVRYLMRFQTEYTCNLLNAECHAAFGREAAKLVLATPVQGVLDFLGHPPPFLSVLKWTACKNKAIQQ